MNKKIDEPETNDKTVICHDAALQCWLKEYEAHINLGLGNWRLRYILVGLNITALGALISLAITKTPDVAVLLIAVMSLVSSSLGIVWVGESIWATRSMNRIRDKIAPALRDLSNDQRILLVKEDEERAGLTRWELLCNIFKGRSPGGATGLFLFFGASLTSWVIALVLGLINLESQYWYLWVLIGIGVIPLYILGAGGYKWCKEWTKKKE